MALRIIKRSRQGTYHIGHIGTNHVICNKQLRATPARRNETEQAAEHMFCKKCFPRKPDTEKLNKYYSV